MNSFSRHCPFLDLSEDLLLAKNVGCSVCKILGLEIGEAVAPDGSVKLLYTAKRKSTVVKTSGI